jgi:predicted Zn-dependent peptidase
MKKSIMVISSALLLGVWLQKIAFEYNLDNGMHVICIMILHPVVITSVMYHVGSKDENWTNGFAHFFEHLLLKEQLYQTWRMV